MNMNGMSDEKTVGFGIWLDADVPHDPNDWGKTPRNYWNDEVIAKSLEAMMEIHTPCSGTKTIMPCEKCGITHEQEECPNLEKLKG